MFRRIDDFVKYYRERAAEHATLFEALTDASLGQAVMPGHRTLGAVAWHIVQSVAGMARDAGLEVSLKVLGEPVPDHAAHIVGAYRTCVEDVLAAVQAQWQDDMLDGEIEMYGEQWKRGFALLALVAHEGHHIGQLTVLMRQAGLPVRGIYGPAKEEWAQYGMEQPADLA
jgi:uncharacterized damage-inducible protein DinB